MSRPKTSPPPVTEQELREAIDAMWPATPQQPEEPTPQARAGDAETLRHIRDWLRQIKEYEP